VNAPAPALKVSVLKLVASAKSLVLMVEAPDEDDALPVPRGYRRKGELFGIGHPVSELRLGDEAVQEPGLLGRNGKDAIRRRVDVQLRGDLTGIPVVEQPPIPVAAGLAEDPPRLANELQVHRVDENTCAGRSFADEWHVELGYLPERAEREIETPTLDDLVEPSVGPVVHADTQSLEIAEVARLALQRVGRQEAELPTRFT
jgi:hypothetical protein